MKPIHLLRLLLLILSMGSAMRAHAQFTYFGLEGRATSESHQLGHGAVALQYLNQFSAHHAYGLELSLSGLLDKQVRDAIGVVPDPNYYTKILWTRKMGPAIGGRYRLFVGNSFFVGASLHLGLMGEFFYADRLSTPTSNAAAPWVPAVYVNYARHNPFMRMQFESGWMWPMGKFLFGSFHGHVGFQKTFAKIKNYSTIQISASQFQDYLALQGVDVLGGLGLGFGVKF